MDATLGDDPPPTYAASCRWRPHGNRRWLEAWSRPLAVGQPLPVLPLWQLEDHYAWRTRLEGPAEVADRLYQGIETWKIAPWFARDEG